MEQMFRLLFVGLFGGLWLSLEDVNCQDFDKGIYKTSQCYNTSTGNTCFTTFLANGNRPVRKPFKTASNWCNLTVPGSSLIIISSLESLRNVESYIGRQELANETIITDAQKLSSRDSLEWSWVNGNATVPINVSSDQLAGIDVACVESKQEQSLIYCTGVHNSQHRYICEYSDSKSASSYRQNKNYYVASEGVYYTASEGVANWYDARKECLRLGGDLASIKDFQTIENWSQLKESHKQRYWIGLHRNKWIWNSTVAAVTYSNWKDGYPDESTDKQCICINTPQCREDNNRTICDYDRKWRTCNCNHNYTIVCQKQVETSGAATAEIDVAGKTLSSTSENFKSSVSFSVNTTTSSHSSSSLSSVSSSTLPTAKSPSQPRTTNKKCSSPKSNPTTRSTDTTGSSLSMTQIPPIYISESQTTALEPSSTGLFDSFSTKESLLILVLFVAVVFIIVAVILMIRKRKYGRRNEISPPKNTAQSETVSPVYATVVPDNNRPSEGTVPPGNPICAEVEMIKQPTPPTSNTIYASVQPTSEAADRGKSVVYADLDFPQKDQQKPRSADKITASLSSSYSQPYRPSTSASNALHAEPIYLEAIDVDPSATQDPSALYAEPMKLKTSS